MSNQNQETDQVDQTKQDDGFIKVKKQGPRGQRLEKRRQQSQGQSQGQYRQQDRPQNVNVYPNRQPQREGLSYRDLLFQFNNLQKRIDSPKVDLVENGDHYVVKMEVPGLKLEDLTIKLKDSQFLIVSGDKTEEHTEETQNSNGHTIVYKESRYGSITRRVKLPTTIKYKNGILSSIQDGVLTVVCKKENPNIKYEKKVREERPQQERREETLQQGPQETQQPDPQETQQHLSSEPQQPDPQETQQHLSSEPQQPDPQETQQHLSSDPQHPVEKVINWSEL